MRQLAWVRGSCRGWVGDWPLPSPHQEEKARDRYLEGRRSSAFPLRTDGIGGPDSRVDDLCGHREPGSMNRLPGNGRRLGGFHNLFFGGLSDVELP